MNNTAIISTGFCVGTSLGYTARNGIVGSYSKPICLPFEELPDCLKPLPPEIKLFNYEPEI